MMTMVVRGECVMACGPTGATHAATVLGKRSRTEPDRNMVLRWQLEHRVPQGPFHFAWTWWTSSRLIAAPQVVTHTARGPLSLKRIWCSRLSGTPP